MVIEWAKECASSLTGLWSCKLLILLPSQLLLFEILMRWLCESDKSFHSLASQMKSQITAPMVFHHLNVIELCISLSLSCITCRFHEETALKMSLLAGPRLLACDLFACSKA